MTNKIKTHDCFIQFNFLNCYFKDVKNLKNLKKFLKIHDFTVIFKYF